MQLRTAQAQHILTCRVSALKFYTRRIEMKLYQMGPWFYHSKINLHIELSSSHVVFTNATDFCNDAAASQVFLHAIHVGEFDMQMLCMFCCHLRQSCSTQCTTHVCTSGLQFWRSGLVSQPKWSCTTRHVRPKGDQWAIPGSLPTGAKWAFGSLAMVGGSTPLTKS